MLLDDVSVDVGNAVQIPAVSEWGLLVLLLLGLSIGTIAFGWGRPGRVAG